MKQCAAISGGALLVQRGNENNINRITNLPAIVPSPFD
jgi:hypothetical protein